MAIVQADPAVANVVGFTGGGQRNSGFLFALRRPDIASAERQVAAANAQVGVARAAFYPTLSLSATLGYQGSDFNKLLTAGSRYWRLGGHGCDADAATATDCASRQCLAAVLR